MRNQRCEILFNFVAECQWNISHDLDSNSCHIFIVFLLESCKDVFAKRIDVNSIFEAIANTLVSHQPVLSNFLLVLEDLNDEFHYVIACICVNFIPNSCHDNLDKITQEALDDFIVDTRVSDSLLKVLEDIDLHFTQRRVWIITTILNKVNQGSVTRLNYLSLIFTILSCCVDDQCFSNRLKVRSELIGSLHLSIDWSKRFCERSNRSTALDWNCRLVLQWLDKRPNESARHLWILDHTLGMCSTDLVENPAYCFSYFYCRIFKHLQKLCKTWHYNLSEFGFLWSFWYCTKSHKRSISELPIFLDYILWNKCNDWAHYIIFEYQSTFLKTATSSFVHSPFIFILKLIYTFYCIQQQWYQKFLHIGYEIMNVCPFVKSGRFNLSNGCPKFYALATNFHVIWHYPFTSDFENLLKILSHRVIFLSSNLYQGLHGSLSDIYILTVESIEHFLYDKVSFVLDLEVRLRVWHCM